MQVLTAPPSAIAHPALPVLPRPDWSGLLLRLFSALDEAGLTPSSGGRHEERSRTASRESLAAESDRELFRLILREYPRSTHGFSIFVTRHWSRIWSICQAVLLNPEDADEAAQDTFLKVHRHLPGFRFESNVSTWMNRIARNTALNFADSRRRARALTERARWDPALFFWWRPWRARDPAGDPSLLESALRSLRAEDRVLLVLRELEGTPDEEIAEALEISPGAVRMRAMRARDALRKRLKRARG